MDLPRPSRNDDGMMRCPMCTRLFVPRGRQRLCSAACRQAVWRRRHPTPLPPIPARALRPTMVYQCPSCEARYVAVQRCTDCGVFCRRVGPGGACPHCEEAVAIADLLPPGYPPA
jgi:hypothetical protein